MKKSRLFRSQKRSQYATNTLFRTEAVEYVFITRSALELGEELDEDTEEEALSSGHQWIESVMEEVLHTIWQKDNISRGDQLMVTLYGGDLDYPIHIPMRQYHSVPHQFDIMMKQIELVQQSKREWMMGNSLEVGVTIVRDVKANGRKRTRSNMTLQIFHNAKLRRIYSTSDKSTCDEDVFYFLNQRARVKYVEESLTKPEVRPWKEQLSVWCDSHPYDNVIVISSPMDGTKEHEIIWRSMYCSASREELLLFWYHPIEERIYRVHEPDKMYECWNHVFCSKCARVTDYRSNHVCSMDVTSPVYRVGKKRPHFKCSQSQRARKTSRVDSEEPFNCLGRSLLIALREMGYVGWPDENLKGWYDEMKMSEEWNETASLTTVRKWARAINQAYGNEENGLGYELCVYDEGMRKILLRVKDGGERVTQPVQIILNLETNPDHYSWIRSFPSWIGKNYFRSICMKGYDHHEFHRCTRGCSSCGSNQVHLRSRAGEGYECESCHVIFGNVQCKASHQVLRHVKGNLVFTYCQRRYRCLSCNATIDRLSTVKQKKSKKTDYVILPKTSHVCYQYDCSSCGEKDVTRGQHWCYVKGVGEVTKPNKNEDREFNLAFFDFETRSLEEHHVVNKVVVLLVCEECVDTIEEFATVGCKGDCGPQRMYVFDNVTDFMDWLLGPHKSRHQLYTFMAHNFKGYDSYPILEECVKRKIKPRCIYQGAKVMTLTIDGIVFKDSVCFIPMALRNFPKTFGTSGGRKGFFPHFFNTRGNANYVGPYPALEYYGIEEMSDEKARHELTEWWQQQEGKIMNFNQELTDYCIQDVLVMMRGCLCFRKLFVTTFGVDPFSECVTIASTCLKVYQRNFLPSKTLGVVPPMGYRSADIYSAQAMEWLYSLNLPHLQSALSSGGEVTVLGAKVDGYDPTSRTVYQYHGCVWHGCPVCFKSRYLMHPMLGVTMQDLYDRTVIRTRTLRAAGYTVHEMWSHDWDVERERHDIPPPDVINQMPLYPRDALMGGRTNAVKLYSYTHDDVQTPQKEWGQVLRGKTKPVHRIRFIDVCSLYPSIMRDMDYPTRHATILTYPDLKKLSVQECTNKISQGEWFGIVKLTIDPPRQLYFPVLPQIINHRLIFALCRTCAENLTQEACTHTDEERSLVGVWTTAELKVALTKGYKIRSVYEVWHYDYHSNELFAEYIRKNLKIKMEASGWPSRCVTESEKRAYMEEVFQREGIAMDYDNVIHNPGMRNMAKLNLNSLWGKFAQRVYRTTTEYLDDPDRYFDLLTNDMCEVTNVILLPGGMVQVTYNEHKENMQSLPYGNVVLGSFVPSYARLCLYMMLERLGSRVLYHDTDSIIYETEHEGDEEIETGSCLGQWEDECGDSDTDWLIEFVSLGPKSYAYRTKSGKCVVKCKGITLTPQASEVVHLESMKRLVAEEDTKLTVHYPRHIQRDTTRKQLKTVKLDKQVQLVYTKRSRQEGSICTLPYGY